MEEKLKAVGPFCLVSMSEAVKDPTQVNVVDSARLTELVILMSKLTIRARTIHLCTGVLRYTPHGVVHNTQFVKEFGPHVSDDVTSAVALPCPRDK